MANDNSRKFKQNQIMFRIQPWIVEFSRSVDFGKDRFRERGSLPVTFCFNKGISYGKRDVYKRQVYIYKGSKLYKITNKINQNHAKLRNKNKMSSKGESKLCTGWEYMYVWASGNYVINSTG